MPGMGMCTGPALACSSTTSSNLVDRWLVHPFAERMNWFSSTGCLTFNLLMWWPACSLQIPCAKACTMDYGMQDQIYPHQKNKKASLLKPCARWNCVQIPKPWPFTVSFNQSHSDPVSEGLYNPDSVGQSDTDLCLVSHKSLCRGSLLWFTRKAKAGL